MSRFDAIDDVPVPDQWDEINRRGHDRTSDEHRLLAPQVGRRRAVLVLAVAVLAVAALGVGVLRWTDDDAAVVANDPPSTDARGPITTTGAAPATTLVCPDGGLVATTVPTDAPTTSPFLGGADPYRQVRSWSGIGDIEIELLLPGFDYIDFVGTPTEQVTDPPGMLLLGMDSTNFIGSTGFAGPCESFELRARGGTEAERRRLLLSTVSGFEFDPSLGAVDCGPLSEAPLHTTEGPNAMAAVRDVEPGNLFLSPQFFGGAPPLQTRPDGRCEIRVATRGGLRPTATISGRGGTYALDAVRGFAPHGLDLNENGMVQLDPSASVSVEGTSFSVLVDYWCDDCAQATLTLHYPDDDLTATATTTAAGAFTGELPRPSTPGSYGWITIVWSAGNTDGRGVWTTNISSGDVAAG